MKARGFYSSKNYENSGSEPYIPTPKINLFPNDAMKY